MGSGDSPRVVNVVKATMNALMKLRSEEEIKALRA